MEHQFNIMHDSRKCEFLVQANVGLGPKADIRYDLFSPVGMLS